MNDSLLNSNPALFNQEKPHPTNEEETESVGNTLDPIPENFTEGYNLVKLDRLAKNTITLNKIKMIIILTIFPLAAVLYTFFNNKWFLMVETKKYEYWVNLIFLENVCQGAYPPHCQNSDIVYSATTVYLYRNNCQYGALSSDDPINLCSVLVSYFYSGLVAACIIVVGIIVHIVHIIQMVQICKRGTTDTTKWLDPQKVPYLIIFLYVGPLVYWFFASATPINSNTLDSLTIFERFGSSIIVYAAALIFFVLLTIFFQRVFSQGLRRNQVNNLLNAEIRYIEGLGPENQEM